MVKIYQDESRDNGVSNHSFDKTRRSSRADGLEAQLLPLILAADPDDQKLEIHALNGAT